MTKVKFIILGVFFAMCCSKNVCAAGLDEIYRDLVRSDNRGYLPLFVKNRQAPSIFNGDTLIGEISNPDLIDEQTLKGLEDINLENERRRLSAEREAAELRWQQVLKNVQAGYVSSFELDELEKHERWNNPQATEVLGWIYAKGIGVKVDFLKSFRYYQKAASLNVLNAKENAVKVYRAMSAEQKALLVE